MVTPTSSVLSLSSTPNTFTERPPKTPNFCPVRRLYGMSRTANLTLLRPERVASTEIVFAINKKGNKTALRFTHLGLAPAFECHGGCTLSRREDRAQLALTCGLELYAYLVVVGGLTRSGVCGKALVMALKSSDILRAEVMPCESLRPC
jgi:hypothetical protein